MIDYSLAALKKWQRTVFWIVRYCLCSTSTPVPHKWSKRKATASSQSWISTDCEWSPTHKLLSRIWIVESDWSAEIQLNVTFARPFPPRIQYKRKEGSSSIDYTDAYSIVCDALNEDIPSKDWSVQCTWLRPRLDPIPHDTKFLTDAFLKFYHKAHSVVCSTLY